MRNGQVKTLCAVGFILLVLFAALNAAVLTVDVQPIGPEGTSVGLAALNGAVFRTVGTSETWYDITDLLGKVSLLTAGGFAVAGAVQLIRRRSLGRVSPELLLMAVLYGLVGFSYVVFEVCIINFRPVLEDGALAASFPSSHTLLTLCIMGSAGVYAGRSRLRFVRTAVPLVCGVCMTVMVAGRMLSGVHWCTDILASVLLSAGLVSLYAAGCEYYGSDQ